MLIRDAESLLKKSQRFDPLVAASVQKALDRIKMLPMSEIVDKIPGKDATAKAKLLGVTRETIYGWLNGRCRPYPQQALRLSELTGFSADEIRGTRSR